MKKNYIMLFILMLLFMPVFVNAAPSGSASCSAAGSVTLNNTITVTVTGSSSEAMWHTTLSYDSSKLQYISGNGLQHISDDFVTSITYTYTFKAVGEGTAYVKTSSSISDYDGQKAFPTSSCSINISKASSNSSTGSGTTVKKSSDNSLAKLEIEGVELSPKFTKDVYEYTAVVESNIEKIDISASANHSKATITGKGEKELVEGDNKFEIVVKAENGSTRTYTINITRKEKDPIVVDIDGETFYILRNLKDIEIPELFEESIIKIKNEEVPVLVNKKLDYTVLVMKDKKANIYFYQYKDNKYTLFNQVISDNVSIVLLEMDKVPTNYTKIKLKINKQEIVGYKLKGDSKILLYGLNVVNGKKNYYSYDRDEKTLQVFDYDKYESVINEYNMNKYLIYGLSVACLLLFILVILLASKSSKQKKLINIAKETVIETKKEEIKEVKEKNTKEKEEIIVEEELDEYDPYNILSNKKKKRRKK